uniref:Uncharacterized protein n=1 Tax=Romanomermis culicivorax TaxID=13658 RepID=A0A915JGJ9_ROMCU
MTVVDTWLRCNVANSASQKTPENQGPTPLPSSKFRKRTCMPVNWLNIEVHVQLHQKASKEIPMLVRLKKSSNRVRIYHLELTFWLEFVTVL